MSDLKDRNGRAIAKFVGDRTPDKTQRLLSRAVWDTAAAMSVVRRFAASGLESAARKQGRRKGRLTVLALDETGQQKKGECTAGVKRQHMGCADGVANGINTVHASLVREDTGHALAGFRQWIPEEHVTDPVRSLRAGLPLDLRFRTKGELAIEICQEVAADGVTPDFTCGDEVYGACTKLREHLEQEEQAYVLRVPKNFRFTMPGGTTRRSYAERSGFAGARKREAGWPDRLAASSSRTSGAAGRLSAAPAHGRCGRSLMFVAVRGRCCTFLLYRPAARFVGRRGEVRGADPPTFRFSGRT